MGRALCLMCFVLGIVSAACSRPGESETVPTCMNAPSEAGSKVHSTLSHVAGGIGGPGYVDAPGASARFFGPSRVAADNAGNLFVADQSNHVIRKIELNTGAVTTIAGLAGMPGGGDGVGTAARFYYPSGLAVDTAGNLYVGDSGNARLCKIVLSTGAVTTIAGSSAASGSADGVGPAARFRSLSGLSLDGAGNLYVADAGNSTIRQVVLSTAMVTTLAGTATQSGSTDAIGALAQFDRPTDVAVDGTGNLFVADNGNNTIRKIVLSTAAVTTLAGTAAATGSTDGTGPAARFEGPSGLAVDAAGNVYVGDLFNDTIRKIVISTGAVTTLAGAAHMNFNGRIGTADGAGIAARFYQPAGLAVDGAGVLFVADSGNNTVRKIEIGTSLVSTVAGAPRQTGSADGIGAAAQFFRPRGVAADGAGNLFIADFANETIRKIQLGTNTVTTVAGLAGDHAYVDGIGAAARFAWPTGIAADGAGKLFVADFNAIRQIELSSGAVTTVITYFDGALYYPEGLAADRMGNLFVADTGTDSIRRIVLGTGAISTIAGLESTAGSEDGVGSAARFASPTGLALDSAGNLYVADSGNHTIRKIELGTGSVTTIAGVARSTGTDDGTGIVARFNVPTAVALDGAGNLLVADRKNQRIRKIELATSCVTTLAGGANPGGLQLGPLPGAFYEPVGVATSPVGEVFIVDYFQPAVLVVR